MSFIETNPLLSCGCQIDELIMAGTTLGTSHCAMESMYDENEYFCALSQRCQKEHLACPSINEIVTGTKFYNFDCDPEYENDDLPPSYEEAIQLDTKLLDKINDKL